MSRHHCSRRHVILASLSHRPCSRCHVTVQSLSRQSCSRCHVTLQWLLRHRAVVVTSPYSRCQAILAVGVTSSLRVLNDISTGRQFRQLCLAHTMCSVTISHLTQCAECYNLPPPTVCRVLQSHRSHNVQSVTISQITQCVECYDLTQRVECYNLTQLLRSPFSSKVVIYGHCLVTLPSQRANHQNSSDRCPPHCKTHSGSDSVALCKSPSPPRDFSGHQ